MYCKASSCAYVVAFEDPSFWGYLWAIVYAIVVDWFLSALAVASTCTYLANKYLRQRHSHSVEQEVEWMYAFDVHINSYMCSFMLTHVLQVRWSTCIQYCRVSKFRRDFVHHPPTPDLTLCACMHPLVLLCSTSSCPSCWAPACSPLSWPMCCTDRPYCGTRTSPTLDIEVRIGTSIVFCGAVAVTDCGSIVTSHVAILCLRNHLPFSSNVCFLFLLHDWCSFAISWKHTGVCVVPHYRR